MVHNWLHRLIQKLTIQFIRIVNMILLLSIMALNQTVYATDVVSYVVSTENPDAKQSYFTDLILLILQKSKKKFGEYQIKPLDIMMGQERTSMMLARNELVTLTWRMTSKSIEQNLQPIYIPLLNGIMGDRIFIIRKIDQPLFTSEMSLAELKKMNAGQGINWPDAKILTANGFSVGKGHDDNLLKMLKAKRFDYFPRALHEPWHEINNEPTLMVEENLMLRYQAPIYFFVNKDNKRLHDRIEYGLSELKASGEFDVYFAEHTVTKNILDKTRIEDRIIYRLDNPLLSKKTKQVLSQQ